MLLTNFQGF
jgi:hypothetical protein